MQPSWTIREAYMQASSFLHQQGISDAGVIAEMIVCHLLGWDRTTLFLRWDEPFPADYLERYQHMVERKRVGEPIQYILGEQHFYGLPFIVSPSVLVPRPETELLVEAILNDSSNSGGHHQSLQVVDIGTGSGAIPISIAVHRPLWSFDAIDISCDALEVAHKNALKHKVDGQITFMHGNLLEPILTMEKRVDILLSNPPYIPSEVIPTLQTEVKDFEPYSALDGGEDGLYFYREIIDQLKQLKYMPKYVGFEIGIHQSEDIVQMLRRVHDWQSIRVIPDLAGIDRIIIARSGL